MARATGATVTDVDENSYADFHMGGGTVLLGHQHPEVDAAPTPLEVRAAETLCRLLPGAEWAKFVTSWQQAVRDAVAVARAYTGKDGVACCTGAGAGARTGAGTGAGPEFAWDDPDSLAAALQVRNGGVAAILLEPFYLTESPDFLAACQAVLTLTEGQEITRDLWQKGQHLMDGLRAAIALLGAPVRCVGVPPLPALVFDHPDPAISRALEREFLWDALKRGVWFRRGPYNAISAAHTPAQIQTAVDVAGDALETAMIVLGLR